MTIAQVGVNRLTVQPCEQSPSPQDRIKHRLWIGVKVQALLRNYWFDTPDEPVLVEMMRDWADILDVFSEAEIRAACLAWIRNEPRRKPNAGDIANLCNEERGRRFVRLRPAPEIAPAPQPQVDYQARRRNGFVILAEAGLASTMPRFEGEP